MKPKLKLLFAFYLLHCAIALYPQQIVTTSGDYHQNSSGSISFTIGEVVTETFSKSANILTQGFHQTNITSVAIKELKGMDFEISAFPNPVKNIIILKVPSEKSIGLKYRLYDMRGNILQNKLVEGTETEVSFINLIPGTYFIKVIEGITELKTFKIVKQ